MKNMKLKIAALSAAVLPSLATFAAEGDTNILGDAQTALEGLITAATPIVSSIIVAGLAVWGGIALIGLLKRAFSAGKGR